MNRSMWVMGVAICAGLTVGCVERRYVVNSDPPGALVLRNGQNIGDAPADDQFVYYGKYHFTLIKDGYTTLQVDQEIPAPWYEYFPLDFFSENLIPWKIIDVHRFSYPMVPLEPPHLEQLLTDAQTLRNQGKAIGPPAPPRVPAAAPASPPAPVPPPPP